MRSPVPPRPRPSGGGGARCDHEPVAGPVGNVEYFLLLASGDPRIGRDDIDMEVARTAGLGVRDERLDQ